ncbi:MAG: sodium:calcium antiporter [Chloroflexota bacterium]
MILVWVKFVVCAAIVVVAGIKLSKYGDAIAEKTSLTGAWVGLLLLAGITSMPELITGVSSVALVGLPDQAVGVVLGSNLFNLLIIAVLDVLHRPGPLLAAVSRRQLLSAGLCAFIIAIAGAGIFVGSEVADVCIGWFGVSSLLLIISYLVSLRLIFRYEQGLVVTLPAEAADEKYSHISLNKTYRNFAIAALCIVGAGIWLSYIGDEIAAVTGWGPGFVGSFFLAIISSLPELTICTAALRLGAEDMAVADILGSNMFNAAMIIAASDLFYWDGSILGSASLSLAFVAAILVVMTGVLMLGIALPQRRKAFRVISWEALVMIGLYFTGAYILY